MRSRVAFWLVTAGSLALSLVLLHMRAIVPWTLAIPIAVTAVPLVIPRPASRVVTASLLSGWTLLSMMGAGLLYVPGFLVAWLAVAHDLRNHESHPHARRALAAMTVVVAALSTYPPRVIYPQLLSPTAMVGGWRFSSEFHRAKREGRLRVAYGTPIPGGCKMHGAPLSSGDFRPLERGESIMGSQVAFHRETCTSLFYVRIVRSRS